MGLLDDAIREHLELKRRRGADPAEVAREQREALEPVTSDAQDAQSDAATGPDASADELARAAEQTPTAGPHGDPLAGALEHESAPSADSWAQPEETAEIDMRTVMDEGSELHGQSLSGAMPAGNPASIDENAAVDEIPRDL